MERKTPDLRALRIVRFPDPILKKVAKPVQVFDASVLELTARMLELMREHEGVGLAGPQVGQSLRIFVCNATGEAGDDLIFVNPLLSNLTGNDEQSEGCLSIPGVSVQMRRATQAALQAVDAAGNPVQVEGAGLLARIWQHEIDHLDGRLIIDFQSTADEIANRKAIKQLREEYRRSRRKS